MSQKKSSAINIVWLTMILIAVLCAAYRGTMEEITRASFDSAKSAVTLALGLIGPMALWLGIMKVVEEAGLMQIIARSIRPLMIRLFPEVPADHPAMSAMIMNMAANALGLGNAATPMGIKAMNELDSLNSEKGTASNAMCLFLAINTSSITLLPLGVINVRAGAGAQNPAAILLPSLFATFVSTITAIIIAKLFERKNRIPSPVPQDAKKTNANPSDMKFQGDEQAATILDRVMPGMVSRGMVFLFIAAFFVILVFKAYNGFRSGIDSTDFFNAASHWMMPLLMSTLLLFGFFRGVKVYETVTDGAKEGFNIAIRILPFLVAIFVAIGMLRASGALEIMVSLLNPLTSLIGMPAEALPMAVLRPLSGSGAFGIMAEVVTTSPDSFLSFLVSTMQGSTETTFYVLAVYFGSVGIMRTRHALPAALCADCAGILASVFICHLVWPL